MKFANRSNSKKSILLVGTFLSMNYGSRSVCEDLADKLIQAGFSVHRTSSKVSRVDRYFDIVYTIWKKRHQYGVAHVDVYSGRAVLMAVVAVVVLRLLQKPYVLTLHGGNLPKFVSQHPVLFRRISKKASALTAPSNYLIESLKTYVCEIMLIPNAIMLENYKFYKRQKTRPRIVWLRAFRTIYNPSLAIKVISLLKDKYPEIHLTMIGPDQNDGSFQEVEQTILDLGMEKHVSIIGKVPKDKIPCVLNNSDIFLNTTTVDNTPVSVIEAMACGLCVVSTNVGGIPYILENEIDSLLVPPNNPDVMASAVDKLITDSHLAKKLSENAREKVELFDWSCILPQWQSLFETIANGSYGHE